MPCFANHLSRLHRLTASLMYRRSQDRRFYHPETLPIQEKRGLPWVASIVGRRSVQMWCRDRQGRQRIKLRLTVLHHDLMDDILTPKTARKRDRLKKSMGNVDHLGDTTEPGDITYGFHEGRSRAGVLESIFQGGENESGFRQSGTCDGCGQRAW